MSRPASPTPARPFASVFFVDDNKLNSALADMDNALGERCFTSEAVNFDFTNYYVPEMGAGIRRIFVAWEKLIDPSALVKIKLLAWDIEERLKGDASGRPVNIDPGLIEQGRLVLATGKATPHRPYLGEGVYVDLTLIHEHKSYRPLPWTYPDYSDPATIDMLNRLRADYLIKLKSEVP